MVDAGAQRTKLPFAGNLAIRCASVAFSIPPVKRE